ncbi:TetR/AcrR family transcriptional regulator [Phytoactinopolyspora halotolerans]|uniref:TetR/AcrR family transcriptional regulator n=1 Tax=Phytoactinopolyspora halotolerans TaxID=1981512 RepID=A0A6L9S3G5_9ACTN|nr:TetR/AcrR family transcriptional regulator [Phytoactinopolyspora halotolerans]NED99121.1 TetR/AcrR family transcriptional regulator [Phytoactinopolyspora halotolerans]
MTTEYSGSGDVNRSLELLWNLRERPTRGPKPGLTLDRIVTAAIEIADAEGLEALSMRKVATKLDVGTMSLYRYIPGKNELLDLMLDRVSEAPPEIAESPSLGWRELLEMAAREHWQLCLEHPWYPFVDQSRPLLGPNGLAGLEYVLTHLRSGTRLSDPEMLMVLSLVFNFVESAARAHLGEKRAEEHSGVSTEEFWATQEPILTKAMESGRYPTMAGLSEDTFSWTHEQYFEFGLARLLDGLQAYIEGLDEGASPS